MYKRNFITSIHVFSDNLFKKQHKALPMNCNIDGKYKDGTLGPGGIIFLLMILPSPSQEIR